MIENKMALFERTRVLWPTVINLDGMIINGKKRRGLQILNELYYNIESLIDVKDEWLQLSIWAFHQSLPEHSNDLINNEVLMIYPQRVTFEVFEKKVRDNLWGDDCWIREREIWQQST